MQLRKFSKRWHPAVFLPSVAWVLAFVAGGLLAEEKAAVAAAPETETKQVEESVDEKAGETEAEPTEEPSEADGAAGESPDGADAADATVDGEAEVEKVKESPYSPVSEALVAIRGDRQSGIGTLIEMDGQVHVVTALSALADNNRMTLRTASGETVPVAGLMASRNSDLAILRIAGDVSDLPVAESLTDAPLESKAKLTLQTPHRSMEIPSGSIKEGRMEAPDFETYVFPGTPVVLNGKLVGVFSPARNAFSGGGGESAPDEGEIWPGGVVFLSSSTPWQAINPLRMSSQARALAQVAEEVQQLGAFLGVSALGFADVSEQPLLAAKSRLHDGIIDAQDKTAADLERVRDRFVFSVTSFSSDIAPTLVAAGRDYYGYFQPEVELLKELYKPVWEKLGELKENPSRADSYAR